LSELVSAPLTPGATSSSALRPTTRPRERKLGASVVSLRALEDARGVGVRGAQTPQLVWVGLGTQGDVSLEYFVHWG
jgi:hypothetical protein